MGVRDGFVTDRKVGRWLWDAQTLCVASWCARAGPGSSLRLAAAYTHRASCLLGNCLALRRVLACANPPSPPSRQDVTHTVRGPWLAVCAFVPICCDGNRACRAKGVQVDCAWHTKRNAAADERSSRRTRCRYHSAQPIASGSGPRASRRRAHCVARNSRAARGSLRVSRREPKRDPRARTRAQNRCTPTERRAYAPH